MGTAEGRERPRAGRLPRSLSRVMTLVVAVGFAVVGIAGAASAHHNTITGTVVCKTSGGWTLTWKVENSADKLETITASSRPGVVPVGTELTAHQIRTFTETITTKPTSAVTLELTGKWAYGYTSTDSGTVPASSFDDGCHVTTVDQPTVPVIDECGPGNAHYGQVPSGPWTSTTNPDGSLTLTASQGTQFTGGQSVVTYPAPVDSAQACATAPVTTPPVTTPPATAAPEVLPAEVRVVSAAARKIDKCGRSGDLFKVATRNGVVYKVKGKVLRQGVWLKAKTRTVTVRAVAADATVRLKGKQVWRLSFTNKACAPVPQVAPNTGA